MILAKGWSPSKAVKIADVVNVCVSAIFTELAINA
jgi:hypothetical protein